MTDHKINGGVSSNIKLLQKCGHYLFCFIYSQELVFIVKSKLKILDLSYVYDVHLKQDDVLYFL